MLTSPAPCSPAGALMSVAVPSRICRTVAGVGRSPLCVLEYASITSAAAPATNGADSLVPPNASVRAFVGQELVTSGLHAASPPEPGATRSTYLPGLLGIENGCPVPVDDKVAMLSLTQLGYP